MYLYQRPTGVTLIGLITCAVYYSILNIYIETHFARNPGDHAGLPTCIVKLCR